MSIIKSIMHQLGLSGDPAKNFTLSVPAAPDGTMKLARGNAGATTQDIMTVDASGNVNTVGLVTRAGANPSLGSAAEAALQFNFTSKWLRTLSPFINYPRNFCVTLQTTAPASVAANSSVKIPFSAQNNNTGNIQAPNNGIVIPVEGVWMIGVQMGTDANADAVLCDVKVNGTTVLSGAVSPNGFTAQVSLSMPLYRAAGDVVEAYAVAGSVGYNVNSGSRLFAYLVSGG